MESYELSLVQYLADRFADGINWSFWYIGLPMAAVLLLQQVTARYTKQ